MLIKFLSKDIKISGVRLKWRKYDIVSNFVRGQINNHPKKLGRKISSNKNKFNYQSEFYLIKKIY